MMHMRQRCLPHRSISLRAMVPWHLNRSPMYSFASEAKSVGTGDGTSCHLSEGLPLLLLNSGLHPQSPGTYYFFHMLGNNGQHAPNFRIILNYFESMRIL